MIKFANQVRDEIIRRGLEEIKETYDEDNYRYKGAVEGFELCKNLETLEDYKTIIDARLRRERKMQFAKSITDEYWQHRYVTLQIEFVYQRMIVFWGASPDGNYSGRAILQMSDILQNLAENG